jgi:hypothetical protein
MTVCVQYIKTKFQDVRRPFLSNKRFSEQNLLKLEVSPSEKMPHALDVS